MPAPRTTTPTMNSPSPALRERGFDAEVYRLLAWLSPGFPTGAFAYSHGLEAAVEAGTVQDRASLQSWIGAILLWGSGRIDADTLRDAYGAATADDAEALTVANRRGVAFRATAETLLETTAQGQAFLSTCRAAWPEPFVDRWAATLEKAGEAVCHPAAVGAVSARAEVRLGSALTGYLQAMAANLASAGLRLGIIGQTDAQHIIAALEPVIGTAVTNALTRDQTCFGTATIAVELASMAHETQYTRLFRS